MFGQEDLRELASYEAQTPVLSVYLNVDPTERTTDEYKLALRQMLREVEDIALPEDVKAVESFFDHEYDWSGRSVVVFSCVEDDFWQAYSLAIPVASGVTVARKPYIWPLAGLMDTYGSYTVALVDRQQLRLLLFEMGELRMSEEFAGEDVRKLKRGRGSSSGHGRRSGSSSFSSQHEEEVVRRNMRDAAEATQQFCQRYDPHNLIIAGTDRTVAQFREELSASLQDKVIGAFKADMNASEPEIRERSLEILQKVEKKRENGLVEAVFTAAAKGGKGVIRLADTLGAAHEGRVQTLVIDRDYHEPGYQCQNCAYITDQKLAGCPFCGGEFAEIPDAAEALVTKVIESGGKVEVVDDNLKAEEFGVGALLRY